MKRVELLKSRAYNISMIAGEYYSNNPNADSMTAFEEGAKWADETIIEKACDYLLTHIDKDLVIYHEQSWKSLGQLVKEFKKAMEE